MLACMTVVLASTDAMPGLAELIEKRHRLGQDGYDEVWDGVYHVAAMARSGHADVQAQLIVALTALAAPRGLAARGSVNIGLSEHDHRVPDAVVMRERLDVVWVPTAAVVVEVVSPGDETYAKFGFYHARGVEELLVADPAERAVKLFRRGEAGYAQSESSAVLEASVAAIAAAALTSSRKTLDLPKETGFNCHLRFMNSTPIRHVHRFLLLALVVSTLAGCSTLPLQPAVNLSEPGWVVREGQAVWKEKPDSEGIAGDLVVAMHWDGRSFVRFTKPPVPLVVAQSTTNTWQAQFPGESKTASGRGRPPERIMWLNLPGGLLGGGMEETDWILARRRGGEWNFWNDLTGEKLDGFLKTTRMPPQHRVQQGEHIIRIVRRYGIMVEALRAVNPDPDSEWLRVGSVINLPALPPAGSTGPGEEP